MNLMVKRCMLWCLIGRVLLGFFLGSIVTCLLRSHASSMVMSCGGGCKVSNNQLGWFSMWHSRSLLSHSKVIVDVHALVWLNINAYSCCIMGCEVIMSLFELYSSITRVRGGALIGDRMKHEFFVYGM